MELPTLSPEQLVNTAPPMAEILFSVHDSIPLPNGKTLTVKKFKNGTVRCIDAGAYRFITQNPATSSKWATMARTGVQIMWVIYQPTNTWVARCVNGETTLL